jgi:uncharacterized oligopeptide transporter (OPT) family protein
VMPHPGMDIGQSLPAPTAAMLAALTQAVFHHSLPWLMMGLGAGIIFSVMLCIRLFKLQRFIQLSILGVAIGMYLPLAASMPLFFGGLIALVVRFQLRKKNLAEGEMKQRKQIGTRLACGLVAGAALLDVVLAIPFSILQSPNVLSLVGAGWDNMALGLALLSMGLLAVWIERRVCD